MEGEFFMKKIMTITMFIFVFNTIVFGTTETPQYPNAIMWEPFYWQYNGSAGDILISALDYENAERTAYRYQDTVSSPDIGCHIKDMKTYIRRL